MKNQELKNIIKNVISALSPKEKQIVISLFGLEDNAPMSLQKTGKEFNISRERTRQIFSRAGRVICHPNNKDYIEDSFILNDMDV